MAKYFVRLRPAFAGAGLGLVLIFGLYWGWRTTVFQAENPEPQHTAVAFREAFQLRDAAGLSKYQITLQVIQLDAAIRALEKKGAVVGPLGVRIYAPQTTRRLIGQYWAMQQRLNYLNHGTGALPGTGKLAGTGNLAAPGRSWEGYSLKAGRNHPIQVAEIKETLGYLARYPWAGNFLKDFRIFLLPYTIPDVSGLGGAGYSMLSAVGQAGEDSDGAGAEIGVTLDHEIGHHLHLSKMPEDTAAGRSLWRQYLKLKGAAWHGPGKVKTQAWSNSSEETFAEDFRMLFGKDQPFYQDVALGDPRSNPAKAAQLRRFMARVAVRPVLSSYHSPWLPDNTDILLWQAQPVLIILMWLVLGGFYYKIVLSGLKSRMPRSATSPA